MEFDYLDSGVKGAFMNMSIDEVLIENENPILRLYRWNPPALSIGRFQNYADVNEEYCRENKIDIVRRLTGGKSVLHDKEVTYCFIIDDKMMPNSIKDSFEIISKALISGLATLGIEAAMNPTSVQDKNNPNCFTEPSFNEVIVKGRKLIGSAQIRTKGKILQHGSILMDLDYNKLVNCLKDNKNQLANSKKRIITLKEIDKTITVKRLIKAIKQGFINQFECEFRDVMIPKKLSLAARDLSRNKYRTWTNKR